MNIILILRYICYESTILILCGISSLLQISVMQITDIWRIYYYRMYETIVKFSSNNFSLFSFFKNNICKFLLVFQWCNVSTNSYGSTGDLKYTCSLDRLIWCSLEPSTIWEALFPVDPTRHYKIKSRCKSQI